MPLQSPPMTRWRRIACLMLAVALVVQPTSATTPLPPLPSTTAETHHYPATTTTTTTSHSTTSTTNSEFSYDNQIIGHPEIVCDYGVVRFKVSTTKGHASSVFVRGQADKSECTFHNTGNVTIELAKCNVRRKREINPSGVAYQMTVVVQLHPLFVTKVDRAYNVNCFYMERRQDVNVEFGVSELTTQMVMADAVLPKCTYSVHRDTPNGPMVKYTRVGEPLYHVWECPSRVYSMLLYNCSAVDGKGSEYPIVDEHGCSKDQFLMPQISYTADNTRAVAESSAFNFPDRNTMSFTCKIRLCFNVECLSVTPPHCGSRSRPEISSTVAGDTGTTQSAGLNQDLESGSSPRSGLQSAPTTTTTTTTTPPPRHEFSTSRETSDAGLAVTRDVHSQNSRAKTGITPRGGGPSSTELVEDSHESPTSTSTLPSTPESSTWPSIMDRTPLPDDFPRPANFLEAVQDSSTEVNEADRVSPSVASSVEERQTQTPTTTAPLVLLKNTTVAAYAASAFATNPTSSFATAANAKNSAAANKAAAAANRQARDTTGTPEWDNPRRHHVPHSMGRNANSKKARTVDFDIASPELTIIDDYEDPSSPSSQLRDTPLSNAFNGHPLSSGNKRGVVCFSSVALICGGVLMTLLAGAVAFILFKAWRKSVHNFY